MKKVVVLVLLLVLTSVCIASDEGGSGVDTPQIIYTEDKGEVIIVYCLSSDEGGSGFKTIEPCAYIAKSDEGGSGEP